MPPQPGEALLYTLFADVHYYFSPPHARPVHHRFDRGSYVYLYHHQMHHRARLEIANHAGTPEQDAFMGYFDNALVQYSHKQGNLVTVTVDGANNPAVNANDTSQWHLPTPDLRNEGKYMYRLNTLDIYFWTKEDALNFVDSLQKTLSEHQLRVSDVPAGHHEHRDSMSPVVQKLEKAAISTKLSQRSNNSVSTSSSAAAGAPTFAGPPMAYNPAAPAAPEPIAHREKTPPPIDAGTGTGLHAASVHDQAYQPSYGHQQAHYPPQQQQEGYFPGPPQQPGVQRTNTSASYATPPPLGSSGPAPYTPSPPIQSSPPGVNPNAQWLPQQPGGGSNSSSSNRQSNLPAQQPQYATYHPQSPGFPPAMQSPSYNPALHSPGLFNQTQTQQPLASPGLHAPPSAYHQGTTPPPPPPPGSSSSSSLPFQQQQQQQQPLGGYSTYSYSQPSTSLAPQQGQAQGYDVHGQAYRPTETELAHGAKKPKPGQELGGGGQQSATHGKLEQRIGKVEKGVGRWLKKLDERI